MSRTNEERNYNVEIRYEGGKTGNVSLNAGTITNLVDKVRLNYKAEVIDINSISELIEDKIPIINIIVLDGSQAGMNSQKPFKDSELFYNRPDEVCYIPLHASGPDDCFTGKDFLRLCDGSMEKAVYVFNLCMWEFPEIIIHQMATKGDNLWNS